jgi:hypothetical protein
MTLKNQDLIYNNLPSRFRREDREALLYRFLEFSGATLDLWDALYEQFFASINPETASEAFIDFWLDRLFDWQFFPHLFTLGQKRALYANFARHLARRGTARGIELWLRDFGCHAKVWLREEFLDEMYFGEPGWTVSGPLLVVVELMSLDDWNSHDLGVIDECFLDESSFIGEPPIRLTPKEIETLLKFVTPVGQQMIVVPRRYEPLSSEE